MSEKKDSFHINPQKISSTNNFPEKVLINLNKCEKLFQEDKSEKYFSLFLEKC